MSGETEAAPTVSVQVPASAVRTVPAVRQEGAIAIGAAAVGALALGALAVGAVAIGRIAIGRLSLGRARPRCDRVDQLHIAWLTVAELHVE